MSGTIEIEALDEAPPPPRSWFAARLSVSRAVLLLALAAGAVYAGSEGLFRDPKILLSSAMVMVFAAFALAVSPTAHRPSQWSRHLKLTIGDDGVYVERPTSKTFIPFARVETIKQEGLRFLLKERGSPGLVLKPIRAGSMRKVVERVVRGRAAAAAVPDPVARTILERGNRTVAEWVSTLRAPSNQEGYRASDLDPDRLWSIVENGALGPSERAAAAVGLQRHLDEAGKARLRVAAEASASPRFRVALQAASDGDEEELSRALEHL
jgi:hypothetical protein